MNNYAKFAVFLGILSLPTYLYAACDKDIPLHKPTRFIDNQDGSVTDSLTNLIWMRCPLGRIWDEPTQTCETPMVKLEGKPPQADDVHGSWNTIMVETEHFNLNGGFAGQTDWRVPNIKELASITMLHCYPPIDTRIFPDAASTTGATQFWSSTPSRKHSQLPKNDDKENPIYEYRTQAWSFSIVDRLNAGKVLETPTDEMHHVLLVRGNSK